MTSLTLSEVRTRQIRLEINNILCRKGGVRPGPPEFKETVGIIKESTNIKTIYMRGTICIGRALNIIVEPS